MPRRLFVIDGGDQGESFLLPEAGTVLIGGSRKHTDICLHDLYVARVHCELAIAEGRVTVSDRETPTGTLVNGAKVTKQDVKPGDVIRVGNSHMRLDEADSFTGSDPDKPVPPPARAPAEPAKLPYLQVDRMGELSGHTLGHYKIGPVLGQGHFGPVFRAHDTKADLQVALKVLPPIFPADTEEMRCFVGAVKPVLFLHHPNLVALRGVGKTGPYVWLAKDLIRGESLLPLIQQASTAHGGKWRPVLRMAVHVARALVFLRRHRLIHANITPANILVPTDGGPVRLGDLGLWDGLVGTALQRQRLERKFLEELYFLSPEHIDPDATPDNLSDQYSLGTVVYALLTGRPPCAGASLEETLVAIRYAAPDKPKDFCRSLPDEFQVTLLRMLAKRPEERYSGPEPLLADLEKIASAAGQDV